MEPAVFLTNNFVIPALSVAQLYKSRWQVELFFRWIKQHLRIKAFYGTSDLRHRHFRRSEFGIATAAPNTGRSPTGP